MADDYLQRTFDQVCLEMLIHGSANNIAGKYICDPIQVELIVSGFDIGDIRQLRLVCALA